MLKNNKDNKNNTLRSYHLSLSLPSHSPFTSLSLLIPHSLLTDALHMPIKLFYIIATFTLHFVYKKGRER